MVVSLAQTHRDEGMSEVFCTITTKSHLFKVFALHSSLQHNGNVPLIVLISDDENYQPDEQIENIKFIGQNDLTSDPLVEKINEKYKKPDNIRWCLKPILMLHLLEQYDKVIYLDNDLYFFEEYGFLFDELNENNILISPHWRKKDTKADQIWMVTNFREGIYNAGFVGANKLAKDTIKWWADACVYRCERNYYLGLWDDQKYLDLFPSLEPKTKVLSHKGCNVAGWNIDECHRVSKDDKVLIEGKYPVVFVHFANYTYAQINAGIDLVLKPYLDEYLSQLKAFKPNYNWKNEISPPGLKAWAHFLRWRISEMLNK